MIRIKKINLNDASKNTKELGLIALREKLKKKKRMKLKET
jgi:hypothetical protein